MQPWINLCVSVCTAYRSRNTLTSLTMTQTIHCYTVFPSNSILQRSRSLDMTWCYCQSIHPKTNALSDKRKVSCNPEGAGSDVLHVFSKLLHNMLIQSQNVANTKQVNGNQVENIFPIKFKLFQIVKIFCHAMSNLGWGNYIQTRLHRMTDKSQHQLHQSTFVFINIQYPY